MRRGSPLFAFAVLGILLIALSPATATPQTELPACDLALQTPVPLEGAGTEPAADAVDSTARALMAPPGSGFTFEGCFTFFPAGPCRDVFRATDGTLWICKDCGTTKKPPGGCSVLTGSGFWCS